MRIWRYVGLAGVAGLASAGAVVAARRRHWRHYDADELRDELQRRLTETEIEP